jgi:tetratricopeptide (TPR) repeat protein
MFDNEEDEYPDGAFQEDLEKFEEMMQNGSSVFFDSDRLEMMLDHFLMSNQFKKALTCVNHSIYQFPVNALFRVRKAQVLSAMGKLNEALNLLMELEKEIGTDQEYILTRASVHSQLRDSKSAIRYFETALKNSDGEEKDEIYLDLSMEYQQMNDLKSAIRILDEALVFNPDNETAVYELAFCYDQSGEVEKAIGCYEKYIDINPYSFTTWYNLGNAFSKAENYEKAAWAYDYSILINDGFASAYFNLGNTFVSMSRYRSAIEMFEKCIELDGEDGITLDYIAEAYEQLEEYDLALLYYKRSMDLTPELPDAWLGTGIVLDLLDRSAEAIHFLRKAAEMEADNSDYLHVLSGCLIKLGELEEAKDVLYKALILTPSNEDVLADYVRLIENENTDVAIDLLEEYGETYDLKGDSRLLLVKLYWLTGKQSDALLLYKDLVFTLPVLAKKLFLHFKEAEDIPQFIQLYELIDEK